jgi:hypothetical protein
MGCNAFSVNAKTVDRPAWLANAHRQLDEAVFAAYGWPASLSDDELLAKLLALNLERAGCHLCLQLQIRVGAERG